MCQADVFSYRLQGGWGVHVLFALVLTVVFLAPWSSWGGGGTQTRASRPGAGALQGPEMASSMSAGLIRFKSTEAWLL